MKHPCTCQHDRQDSINGKGIRIFNMTKPTPGSNQSFRCTVCLKVVQVKCSEVKQLDK